RRAPEPSAKLDVVVLRVLEAVDERHKTLVFSQFTSLLAILRSRLDEAGASYEYLDGRTRDRQAKVERFQRDPNCRLFLISLKAGGLGLNLTAAEYVFLLEAGDGDCSRRCRTLPSGGLRPNDQVNIAVEHLQQHQQLIDGLAV